MNGSFMKYYLLSQRYGESFVARQYSRQRLDTFCHSLYQKELLVHYGCVNAIDFSNDGSLMVSGGDDKRVLLWNCNKITHIQHPQPIIMKSQHSSNIFCTTFDVYNQHIFSAGNDETVLMHNIERMEAVNTYSYTEPVYAVTVPVDDSSIFATAGEDGTVQVCDVRSPDTRTRIAFSAGSFHSVVFNPVETRILATANSLDGVALWDLRYPESMLFQYGLRKPGSAMSVRFDYTGTKLFALLRKSGPVLYDIDKATHTVEFCHEDFSNICTMKSACFAGDKDQFIVSGSDDFNVYIWKIPEQNSTNKIEATAYLSLEGHRSIVNQVRYNRQFHILASAGVEKVVKIWSPYCMNGATGDLTGDEHFSKRSRYSHEQYMRLVIDSGHMNHDYDLQSVEEDPRMLAFFDTLIERTRNEWVSDSSDDETGGNRFDSILDLLTEARDSPSRSPDVESDSPDYDSSRVFGVSVEELRRIFRRGINRPNRPYQQETSDSDSDVPTRITMAVNVPTESSSNIPGLNVLRRNTPPFSFETETNIASDEETVVCSDRSRSSSGVTCTATSSSVKNDIKKRNKRLQFVNGDATAVAECTCAKTQQLSETNSTVPKTVDMSLGPSHEEQHLCTCGLSSDNKLKKWHSRLKSRSHSDSDSNVKTNSNSQSNASKNSDCYLNSSTNSHSNPNVSTNPHFHSNVSTNSNFYSIVSTKSNCHSNISTNSNFCSNASVELHSLVNDLSDSNCDSNSSTNSNSHSNLSTNSHSSFNLSTNSHTSSSINPTNISNLNSHSNLKSSSDSTNLQSLNSELTETPTVETFRNRVKTKKRNYRKQSK